MRTKLGLTEKELMRSSWVSVNLQMFDFPYWQHRDKDEPIEGEEALKALEKYMSR